MRTKDFVASRRRFEWFAEEGVSKVVAEGIQGNDGSAIAKAFQYPPICIALSYCLNYFHQPNTGFMRSLRCILQDIHLIIVRGVMSFDLASKSGMNKFVFIEMLYSSNANILHEFDMKFITERNLYVLCITLIINFDFIIIRPNFLLWY
uniref:Uncharacterized protein n=1 Tax=Tetranychus urticae TaxID=32264 RepID=T1K1I1_TETUR